jgi:uncharacterized LabA/DUF88 family protein
MGFSPGPNPFLLERRESSYLFIDGGYLRKQYEGLVEKVFAERAAVGYDQIATASNCAKAFYYDCVDELKPTESDDVFAERKKAQETLFDGIREIPGFHVRTGTLSGNKRQKEVDVALAVDMLTHAFYKNMVRAVLIAGDLDFRPVVECLIRLGTWVEVWSVDATSAKLLHRAADQHRSLTFRDLYSWATPQFKRDHKVDDIPSNALARIRKEWAIKEQGTFQGRKVELLMSPAPNNWSILIQEFHPRADGGTHLAIRHQDRDVVERYFEVCFGKIEWATQSVKKGE